MIFEIFNFLTIFIIQLTSSSPILSSVEAESKVKAKLFLDDNILIDGYSILLNLYINVSVYIGALKVTMIGHTCCVLTNLTLI